MMNFYGGCVKTQDRIIILKYTQMSFIRINNRKNFLITEVPTLHPQSLAYVEFWRTHKQSCIEGLWSIDDKDITVNIDNGLIKDALNHKGNWRFMPGNLYFYVNFGIILHRDPTGPKSAPKKKIRPDLRDIEWELFYNWLEARGFSGFKDDDDYTCNRDLVNKDFVGRYDESCYNKKGELKEYIDARQYLRRLHDKPLGRPLYQNMAQDLFWLGPRGIGKSFSVGVGIILYELLFDGAKEYNEESRKNPAKVEIFVGAALTSKSSDLLQKSKQAMDNLPGAWGEKTAAYTPPPFFKQMSGTLGPNNMKNTWRHEYDKKIGGTWQKFGTGSNIKHGIYTTENPEAAAGGRYAVAVVEEWGLLGNSLAVHGSNTATMMDFPWKFGSSIWIGTGGNVEKIQEGEVMFRNPKGFEALEFEDEWEGTGKIGWFFPAYYGMNEYKDENGNTNVEEAKLALERRRDDKRKSKDPSALALEMMNYPIVPSEMFLNAKGSMFPQAMLKSQIAEVTSNPHRYEHAHYYVELEIDVNGKIKMEHANSNALERDWPVKDNKNKPGVIEIYELPKKDTEGNTIKNRYIQGTDTYDDDESVTSSLGSTWIMDLWTSRLVAEYTGRRNTKEFYEITRRLNLFYAADHNYENNKKGLYTYYDQKHSTNLLCDTPESLRDISDITISKLGNKRKGTTASKPVNAYGLKLILEWLLEPAYGEEEGSEKLVLHTIKSVGLLKELLNYNNTGNFDRVSALIMLLILREEKLKYLTRRQEDQMKQLSADPFFERNFSRNTPNQKNTFNFPSIP